MTPVFTEFTHVVIIKVDRRMPKIVVQCSYCTVEMERFACKIPKIPYCSVACFKKARAEGLHNLLPKKGKMRPCEVCGADMYLMKSREAKRFCSVECRTTAIRTGLTPPPPPNPIKHNGIYITCKYCGDERYRNTTLIKRGIDKTCGKPACVSAYKREQWGRDPHPEYTPNRRPRSVRTENFTSKQRRDWIVDHCNWCNATTNLALDHVIPVIAGGKSTFENSQTLCQPCNMWKCHKLDKPLATLLRQLNEGGRNLTARTNRSPDIQAPVG